MKVVLSSRFHISHYQGGSEVYSDSIATALSQQYQVFYLTTSPSPKAIYPYQILSYHNSTLGKHPFPSSALARLTQSIKPDFFHAFGISFHHHYAHFIAKHRLHIPTIFSYMAPSNTTNPLINLGSKLEATYIKTNYHTITTLTALPKSNSLALNPILPPHISQSQTISQSTAQKKLNLSSHKIHLLIVASLDQHHYYKGIDIAINSLALLPDNYHLTIIGEGSQKKSLQQQAAQLGLNSRITFTGSVSKQDLTTHYQAIDIFLLPSTSSSEGFGIVLLEALYFQLPIITTKPVGLAPALTKADIGRIIPPKSTRSLATAIQKTSQPDRKQKKHFRQFALSYNQDQLQTQLKNIYHHASQKNNHRSLS